MAKPSTPEDKVRERVLSEVDRELWAIAWHGKFTDSPIEKSLLFAIKSLARFGECSRVAALLREGEGDVLEDVGSLSEWDLGGKPIILMIDPQKQIESFRVDFLMSAVQRETKIVKSLIVECDGHDFHERTKQQAASDRSRDRRLQELGYTVYRFTGSEIWRDPCKCAEQILSWACEGAED